MVIIVKRGESVEHKNSSDWPLAVMVVAVAAFFSAFAFAASKI